MNIWQLPTRAIIAGKAYELNTDYRNILEIFAFLEAGDIPQPVRWQGALLLFYRESIPLEHQKEAMEYFCRFACGGSDPQGAGEKLFDWQLDAGDIIADINALAGKEIRGEESLHWWTFLSLFHSIGQGRLGQLVQLRRKLRRGEKLDSWEQQFYREHKAQVDLRPSLSREELEEKQRLEALLGR